MQFVQALADGGGVGLFLGLALRHQVLDRDADQHAVDRLARPIFGQHLEEAQPAFRGRVGFLDIVLGGVLARGVDQHRFLGEPPVAVARTACARDRLGPAWTGQREFQARVDQRRRLARTRRSDDDVPGQIIEIRAAAAAGRALERRHRVLHLFAQDRCFIGGADDVLFQLLVLFPSAQDTDQPDQTGQQPHATDDRQLDHQVIEAKQGGNQPDDHAERDQTEDGKDENPDTTAHRKVLPETGAIRACARSAARRAGFLASSLCHPPGRRSGRRGLGPRPAF